MHSFFLSLLSAFTMVGWRTSTFSNYSQVFGPPHPLKLLKKTENINLITFRANFKVFDCWIKHQYMLKLLLWSCDSTIFFTDF